MRLPHLVAAATIGLVASATLASCSSDSVPPTALASVSPTPSPSTPAPPPVDYSPFTGKAVKPSAEHKVLAVKFDNTANSHPQAGIDKADIVYLEQVEWGLTRVLAVFGSHYPKAMGPIRSARISDLELLQQYGKLAFSFSGAQQLLLPFISAAPLYDVSADTGSSGYWRESGRFAPYDYWGDPKKLAARAPHATKPQNIGLRFSTAAPAGGRLTPRITASWPGAVARFTWSGSAHRYLLTMDGQKDMAADGTRLGASTLIVQYCDVHPSQFGDKFGGNTPLTETVGKGKALVLRNGRMWHTTWKRSSARKGTHYFFHGKPMDLARGQVWILLLDKTLPATIAH
jgi:hypothetical protein